MEETQVSAPEQHISTAEKSEDKSLAPHQPVSETEQPLNTQEPTPPETEPAVPNPESAPNTVSQPEQAVFTVEKAKPLTCLDCEFIESQGDVLPQSYRNMLRTLQRGRESAVLPPANLIEEINCARDMWDYALHFSKRCVEGVLLQLGFDRSKCPGFALYKGKKKRVSISKTQPQPAGKPAEHDKNDIENRENPTSSVTIKIIKGKNKGKMIRVTGRGKITRDHFDEQPSGMHIPKKFNAMCDAQRIAGSQVPGCHFKDWEEAKILLDKPEPSAHRKKREKICETLRREMYGRVISEEPDRKSKDDDDK